MSRFYLVCLLICASSFLVAQKPTAQSPTPKELGQTNSQRTDPEKLAANIRGSYYHPDQLGNIQCNVSFDWSTFFTQLKTTIPDQRIKELQSVKIKSDADRGKAPRLTFDWGEAELGTKDQFESGVKQIVEGFYQAYWPMFASSLITSSKEFVKIESKADGSSDIYESAPNMSTVVTVDKNGLPVHYSLDGLAMKGTIDAQYVNSPQPRPGDLRRLVNVSVHQQIGTSEMNVQVDLDYQTVEEFIIPQHVTFNIPGAYAIKMEFTDCSATPIATH